MATSSSTSRVDDKRSKSMVKLMLAGMMIIERTAYWGSRPPSLQLISSVNSNNETTTIVNHQSCVSHLDSRLSALELVYTCDGQADNYLDINLGTSIRLT
jgi:hypothetical protein